MNVKQPFIYGNSEWFTPRPLLNAVGPFDLDPCSHPSAPWKSAQQVLTKNEDGMQLPWFGRVWLCPPLDNQTKEWVQKAIHHGNVTALLPSRTDSAIWQNLIFPNASAVLFLAGRVRFHRLDGSQAGPSAIGSALIAFDNQNTEILKNCGLKGHFIRLKS